jgi:hypothetical protein
MTKKTIDTISVGDIQANPVWKFCRGGDMAIEPVTRIPCKTLNGRIVGTQVELADGTIVWALLGNINTENPAFSKHFMTLSIESSGDWFHLARYHDYDYDDRGPQKLSEWIGKPLERVFPIAYDIRHVFKGESVALKGKIEKEPSGKLTRAEIIAMAVP